MSRVFVLLEVLKNIAILVALLAPMAAWSENDDSDWSDDWGDDAWDEQVDEKNRVLTDWNITGSNEFGLGHFVESNITEDTKSLAESRMQLKTHRYFGNSFFNGAIDLTLDAIEQPFSADVRELYFDRSFGKASARIGRQVLTWGTGDFVFLNDFFPKDWKSMFAGRDDRYLKASSDTIKLSCFGKLASVDVVWAPSFSSDTFVDGERFSYFNPMTQSYEATPSVMNIQRPKDDLSNGQYYGRLFNTYRGHEWALYVYDGFYMQPLAYSLSTDAQYFPGLIAYGASYRSSFWQGGFSLELSNWDSVEDRAGTNPFIPNSESHYLVGFEKELIKNWTLGIQYYSRHAKDVSAASDEYDNQQNRVKKNMLTARLTHSGFDGKWVNSIFLFHSTDVRDNYLKMKSQYRVNDRWSHEFGVNIFDSESTTLQWGQFELNSNAYLRVKYQFL